MHIIKDIFIQLQEILSTCIQASPDPLHVSINFNFKKHIYKTKKAI